MKSIILFIILMSLLVSGGACYISGQIILSPNYVSEQKISEALLLQRTTDAPKQRLFASGIAESSLEKFNLLKTDDGITKIMEDKLFIYKESISVICTSPIDGPNIIEKVIGTGINFIYKNYIWVISCRHVVEPEFGKSKINSFLRIYDKNSGQLRNTALTFKDTASLRFHPDDFDDRTRDIALFNFNNISKISQKFNFFELPVEINLPQLKDNDSLIIIGYPSKDFSYNILINDTGKELPLTILRASYLPFNSDSKVINYGKTVIEQNRAAIDNSEGLAGMSGSLVLLQHGNEYLPVGMVTGSGNGRVIEGTDTTKINFINFVHLRYLYDLLKNIEQ